MGTLAGILKKLSQIFSDIPQPLKYSLLFSFLVLPYLPHPKPRPQLPLLPQGVERIYVTAGDGKGALEVLVAKSTDGEETGLAPLLFVHGGYGSAFCWQNWLPYFANKGRTVYAVSLSGHGYSTRPSFYTLRPKSYFAKDILAILNYIDANKGDSLPPVLVGHSAGGGLSQYTVDIHGASLRKQNRINGVIGVSPFPPHGGLGVYVNWFFLDPGLVFRMLLDPYRILSTPRLASRAFFGEHYCRSLHPTGTLDGKADDAPEGYMQQMTKEESVAWPSGMLFPFINTQRASWNMTFINGTVQTRRIHLVAGKQDALMSPDVMRRTQKAYGCGLDFVESAGHHLMLDIPWEEGAQCVEKIIREWGI